MHDNLFKNSCSWFFIFKCVCGIISTFIGLCSGCEIQKKGGQWVDPIKNMHRIRLMANDKKRNYVEVGKRRILYSITEAVE